MTVSAIQIRRHLRLLLPLLIFLTVLAAPSSRGAHAEPVLPLMRGPVVDESDVLRPEQETLLAKQLDTLKGRSSFELVVVTLPSLQGYSIEQWGKALGEGWYVGGKNGVGALLIVAPNDRQVRIEVGDGLTRLLTDVESSVIIDTRIIPQFRAGEMSGGILAGVDAMIDELMPSMAPIVPQVVAAPAATEATPPLFVFKWGIILFVGGVLATMAIVAIRRLRRLLTWWADSGKSDNGQDNGGGHGPGYGPGAVVRRRGIGSGATISFGGSQSSRSSLGGAGSRGFSSGARPSGRGASGKR